MQSSEEFNVLLYGASGAGKSCLLRRLRTGYFQTVPFTVGVDTEMYHTTIRNKTVKLVLFDTSGQERFITFHRSYLRTASAAMIFYDITRTISWETAQWWVEWLKEQTQQIPVIVLVATKLDINRRQIEPEEVGAYVDNNGLTACFETSAHDGTNVNEPFEFIAEQLMEMKYPAPISPVYDINTPVRQTHNVSVLYVAVIGFIAVMFCLLLCCIKRIMYQKHSNNKLLKKKVENNIPTDIKTTTSQIQIKNISNVTNQQSLDGEHRTLSEELFVEGTTLNTEGEQHTTTDVNAYRI
eukprot:12957_1